MEPVGQSASKTGRDGGFMVAATVLGNTIGDRIDLDSTQAALLGTVIFLAISFGWRTLRHFAPWVADEPAQP